MKDAPHDDFAIHNLIEEDVTVKGTGHHEKTPCREARMSQRCHGAKQRLAFDERAGACDDCQITLCHVPPAFSAYHWNCSSVSAMK
ncbi:MAG: hypothetical protein WCK55_18035 [Verrucomicrobiota bacterium]